MGGEGMGSRRALRLLLALALALGTTAGADAQAAGVVVEADNSVAATAGRALALGLHEHEHGDEHGDELEDDGVAVRCRVCGATVAYKRDLIELHDTSKAISSRREAVLGDHAEIFTFVNPSRAEFELAGFRTAVGVEDDAFSNTATVFDGYSWRDLRCSSCKRHIGWAFYHDELQQCMNTQLVDSMAARAHERLAATEDERQRKAAIVDKAMDGACVVASAGWWTYEVCYKQEVRQFHQEPDGSRPSDWSMGKFVAPGDASPVATGGAEVPAIYETDVAHYFAGGQHCDENGELRNSKVVYTCCKARPSAASVDKIDEPALCSYLISVCVPELCEGDAGSATDQQALGLDGKVLETCKAQFDALHAESNLPATFAALRWSTVISEDSSELAWARRMQFRP